MGRNLTQDSENGEIHSLICWPFGGVNNILLSDFVCSSTHMCLCSSVPVSVVTRRQTQAIYLILRQDRPLAWSPSPLGLQAHTTTPGFFFFFFHLRTNLGSHAFKASTLETEPFPWPS